MTNTLAVVILALALQEGDGKISPAAIGKAGERGSLQIQKSMLEDHHRRTGERYTKEQATEWNIATNIATRYILHYGKGKWTPVECAKAWNAGPDMSPNPVKYVKGFKAFHAWVLKQDNLDVAYTNALVTRVVVKK